MRKNVRGNPGPEDITWYHAGIRKFFRLTTALISQRGGGRAMWSVAEVAEAATPDRG